MSSQALLSRRGVLIGVATVAVARSLHANYGDKDKHPRYTAAVIGHTGRGNYGHDVDLVFRDRDNVETVALADPDAAGREKAAARAQPQRQYADYREMLEKEKPQLVAVCPRWTDQHHAMAMAALGAGAHLYMEKPITTTLAEADEILALAEKKKLKIVVAHQMRMGPSVMFLKKQVDGGLLGDLLEMRAWGKQDPNRTGGEDMLVLGTHMFDLMRMFGGDVVGCSARVTQNGKEITKADARQPSEQIGPVAGDEISAQFHFTGSLVGSFTSRARMAGQTGHWGLELIGSKGSARILADIWPRVFYSTPQKWSDGGRTEQWKPMESDPAHQFAAGVRGFPHANARLVDDWLEAIAKDREPTCSGRNAAKALEMVMAVYQAALAQKRVAVPLEDRRHPLL
jgi:predicted dehydrogenase